MLSSLNSDPTLALALDFALEHAFTCTLALTSSYILGLGLALTP